MTCRFAAVTVDCHDPLALAGFWAGALGARAEDAGNRYVAVPLGQGGDPSPGPGLLLFQGVPEERVGKNRLHLDLSADDPQAERERLVALGARVVEHRDDSRYAWWVMADPEGNVFCLAC